MEMRRGSAYVRDIFIHSGPAGDWHGLQTCFPSVQEVSQMLLIFTNVCDLHLNARCHPPYIIQNLPVAHGSNSRRMKAECHLSGGECWGGSWFCLVCLCMPLFQGGIYNACCLSRTFFIYLFSIFYLFFIIE